MASLHSLLYLGSYARAEQPGIHALAFDSTFGLSTQLWTFSGIVNPSFLVLHPNGRWLFAVSEMSQHHEGRKGEVWALQLPLQEAGEQPVELNHRPSQGDWPCHLSIDTRGKWLLVSNYQSGSVSVFPILGNGELGELAEHVQHSGSGPHPERQTGPHAHSTIFTLDERFVVVADLGIDRLVVYAFDSASGKLSEHQRIACQPGSGPRHMAFHPAGQHLFVSHELNNTVVVYDYDGVRGTLRERQSRKTVLPDAGENLAAHIQLNPAGNLLYVSNRGDDSLAIFPIMADGSLGELTVAACGARWPRHFAFHPSGNVLLVANQLSNEVSVLPDPAGEPLARIAIPGVSCVQFAPE